MKHPRIEQVLHLFDPIVYHVIITQANYNGYRFSAKPKAVPNQKPEVANYWITIGSSTRTTDFGSRGSLFLEVHHKETNKCLFETSAINRNPRLLVKTVYDSYKAWLTTTP